MTTLVFQKSVLSTDSVESIYFVLCIGGLNWSSRMSRTSLARSSIYNSTIKTKYVNK